MLVPMLDELIHDAAEAGAREVLLGMAHRGRLNVLAHVLGKPYAAIFAEFHAAPNKELVPSEGSTGINYGWTGDVKYHLGASAACARRPAPARRRVQVTMAPNPSHLEFVNPVVEGMARAAQDDRDAPGAPRQDADAALAVLIHGDAAFPGQGVVAETLNLSRLRRLPHRRHHPHHRQQPARLHHRAREAPLDALRQRPRQGLRDPDRPRQRRRPRGLPRRGAAGRTPTARASTRTS